MAGQNSDAGGKLHCRRHGGHRSARPEAYGPWFGNPEAPGESWGGGELAQAITTAGGEGWSGGCHGRRPRAHGARGLGDTNHETQNESHGEREGATASSPRARNGGGDGSETTATRTARSEIGGAPPCGSCGRDEAKMERGQQEGARGGLGCLLTRPRQREDSHDARRGRGCAAA